MKIFFFTTLFLGLFINAALALDVINSNADFKDTIEGWETIPHPQKIEKWEHLESKYQELYDQFIYVKSESDWKAKQAKIRRDYFMNFANIKNKTLNLFGNAESIIRTSAQELKIKNPNFDDNITVVIIPTLFKFTSLSVYDSSERKKLILVGLDTIVYQQKELKEIIDAEFSSSN